MAGKIFISYRREDDPAAAARVRDALASKFGKANLFMDVDSLIAGQRFDDELRKALAVCDVLIAITADTVDADFVANVLQIAEPNVLAKLRAVPPERLVDTLNVAYVITQAMSGVRAYAGTAMIDGDIVKDEPGNILSSPDAPSMPLLIGTTARDLPLFFPPLTDWLTDPYSYFGSHATEARAVYPDDAMCEIGRDMMMHEPARFVAKAMTARHQPAWLYRFTYAVESQRRDHKVANHSQELPFLFQTLDSLVDDQGHSVPISDNDKRVARVFSTYFTNFAKNMKLSSGGIAWPEFNPSRFELMNFR